MGGGGGEYLTGRRLWANTLRYILYGGGGNILEPARLSEGGTALLI